MQDIVEPSLTELEGSSPEPEEASERPAEQSVLRTFVVMNPVAGTTDADEARAIIEETLSSAGIEYEIYLTRKEDDVSKIVAAAIDRGFAQVAAIGGDGTVSLVAAALVKREIPLVILPAGSGNVLARDLGIPLNLPSALELLTSTRRIRTLDAMQIGERYFFLNVSAGISSLTMHKTKRADKRRFGMLAYLLRGLETLSKLRPFNFRLIVDGEEHRMPGTEVLIANASFMGIDPYIQSDREVCPDDGILDVCVVLARKLIQAPALAIELLARRPLPVATLQCMPAKTELYLDANRHLPVQGDGEPAGYTPVKILIVPHALQVVVPEPAD